MMMMAEMMRATAMPNFTHTRARSRTQQPMDGRTDERTRTTEMDSTSLSVGKTQENAAFQLREFPASFLSCRRRRRRFFSSVIHFGSNSLHFCRERGSKFSNLVA